jgi:quercetin dioxygenase-like cupin family protein
MFTLTRIQPKSRRTTVAVAGLVLAITLGLALTAITVLPGLVRAVPLPIATEVLTPRAQFTDTVDAQLRVKLDGQATSVLNMPDASRTVVARFTIQPNVHFPWHTHPGPVIVNVVQGELVYVQASDCVHRPYPTGTGFVDPGNNIHSAFNPSSTVETIIVATFLDVPADGPLSLPDANQNHCAMEGGDMGGH